MADKKKKLTVRRKEESDFSMVLVRQDCMDAHPFLFSICLYVLPDSSTLKAWFKENANMSPSHRGIYINLKLPQ